MIFTHKITDLEKTTLNNRDMYIIVKYNPATKLFMFGGRISNMDFMLETIQGLFEIDSEFINEPKFNQNMNIRWNVPNLDLDHYNRCMLILKGNYHFKYEQLKQLKRMM